MDPPVIYLSHVGFLVIENQKEKNKRIKRNYNDGAAGFAYQWSVTLYWTWFTTLIKSRSPSLATIRGPGSWPLTVTMLLVWHNLVTFCILICNQKLASTRTLRHSLIKALKTLFMKTFAYIKLVMPGDASVLRLSKSRQSHESTQREEGSSHQNHSR